MHRIPVPVVIVPEIRLARYPANLKAGNCSLYSKFGVAGYRYRISSLFKPIANYC